MCLVSLQVVIFFVITTVEAIADDGQCSGDQCSAAASEGAVLKKTARPSLNFTDEWTRLRAEGPGSGAGGGLLFCYSIVTPTSVHLLADRVLNKGGREPTVHLLAGQLAKACDGWALLSAEDDPELNLHRAYSLEDMVIGFYGQMREMVTQGTFRWLAAHNVFEQYRWIVKFDPDSFVRPSTFRKGFERYPASFNKILSTGNLMIGKKMRRRKPLAPVTANEEIGGSATEGFFTALPTKLAARVLELANSGSRFCDIVFSGHNHDEELRVTKPLCNEWSALGWSMLHGRKPKKKISACNHGMRLPAEARYWLAGVLGLNSNKQSLEWRLLNGGRLVNRTMDRVRRLLAVRYRSKPWKDVDGLRDYNYPLFKAQVGSWMKVSNEDNDESPDDKKCLAKIGADGIEFFVDGAGDALVAMDSNGHLPCKLVGAALLTEHRSKPGQRLCNRRCPLGGQRRAVCVSANFSVVHAAKKVALYQKMVKAFP